ncbi:MAG: type II toxin-antitoxin system PemK/MazF family toxin, partial [Oscillospiraceae bacterium]|nr:type II toxin-antitoxin system PemK/MazF family toxin [Oscillospiraceae bacterium]
MYQPEQGDILMMNVIPQAGQEQENRRAAVMISNSSFHRFTHMAVLCPIMALGEDYPMHVKLDARTQIQGEVLCEHVKSLDLSARNAVFIEKIPDDLLAEVLERVRLSIG